VLFACSSFLSDFMDNSWLRLNFQGGILAQANPGLVMTKPGHACTDSANYLRERKGRM